MRKSLHISFVASFLFFAALAGCSSNTTGPGSNTSAGSVTRPGVGSQYIRYNQFFDTAGHSLPALAAYDTLYVIASGISYQGKTNVVEFRYGSEPTRALIFYVNYESNGDIASYVDGQGSPGKRSGWEVLPLASKGTTSFTTYDSSGVSSVTRLTYAGEQHISEAGKTLDALVFDYQSLNSSPGGGSEVDATDYFSPSIGYYSKVVEYYSEPAAVVGGTSDLVSYTLK